MSSKELAEKYMKAEAVAWETGNCDALEKLEAPEVTWHLLARNQDISGWDALKQYILGVRMMFSNIKQEWQYLTGEGNLFTCTYKASMTLKGGMTGAAKEMTMDSLWVCRFNNAKVAEVWTNGTSKNVS